MNVVALSGRLTKEPNYSMSQNGEETREVARFTLATDRDGKDAGADFISCVCFGHTAHFVQQYLKKGSRIEVEGRIQTGSYTNKDNQKVYTTDVVANRVRFGESKAEAESRGDAAVPENGDADFMNIPDSIVEELPF